MSHYINGHPLVYKSKNDVGIKFVDPTSAALPEIKISNSLTNEWEVSLLKNWSFSGNQGSNCYIQILT